eukprot:COSAG02_NODE_44474_length_366_cov_0.505618_1_plen_35_part_01
MDFALTAACVLQELTGGMRADGGSIVSVHGDAPIV